MYNLAKNTRILLQSSHTCTLSFSVHKTPFLCKIPLVKSYKDRLVQENFISLSPLEETSHEATVFASVITRFNWETGIRRKLCGKNPKWGMDREGGWDRTKEIIKSVRKRKQVVRKLLHVRFLIDMILFDKFTIFQLRKI